MYPPPGSRYTNFLFSTQMFCRWGHVLLRSSSYDERILSSVHKGNLIPVTEMKNVHKAPKIPVEPRSDLSATLQAMRSWKCFVTDSPGIRAGVFIWEIFFSSVTDIWFAKTKISVTGRPARLLIWTHRNLCKEKSGEARSRKPRASLVDRAHMKRP